MTISRLIVLIIGVSLLEAQELPDREIHYRPGDWISYPVTRFVTSIALGHQYTYFGTTGGIARYDFYRHRWDHPFTMSDGMGDDNIHVVAYDFSSGYLWCVTDAGLSYHIPSSEEWLNLTYLDLRIDWVSAVGIGREHFWLKSSGGLLKGSRHGGPFWDASQEEESRDDVRWFGNAGENGSEIPDFLFMEDGYSFFPEGYIQDIDLRQFDITGFEQDQFNNLWMATRGLGSGVADIRTSSLELLPYGLFTSIVNVMAWDEAGMWIGGRSASEEQGGITWWDMDNGEWVYFEAPLITRLRSDLVTAIQPDTAYVWFGTLEGLARYDKYRDTWKGFSVHNGLWEDEITSLAMGNEILWVGTGSGINRILLPEMVVEQVRDKSLIHRTIHHLETNGNNVWAGTDRGIFRYSGNRKRWEYVPGYEGMVDLEVTAVSVWENEVWFGTDDGIEMYDQETDEWVGYPATHFPTGGVIHNMLADSGAVWVATENGVLKFLKWENRWRRFTVEDGLLDNSVRWILLDGDYVWFGTGRGLTRFYWNAPYRID
jgi:ligand-binding sensor domain-containing protein